MNLKLFVLAACLLAGSAYAQGNQDSSLNDFGTSSNMDDTELSRADTSLQSLIDLVSDGASVELLPDTYVLSQPISINKNITLVGSPFVHIDGSGTSQILNIDNPKANVTIENVLFTHGNGSDGGAIANQARSLTIKNCSFYDNMANNGSGVYQKSGNLKIVNSTFKDNKATHWGTAVYCKGGDVQLENSTFDHNFGLGVIIIRNEEPDQANVLIKGCSVSNNGLPVVGCFDNCVALFCLYTNTLIDHCIINNNNFTNGEPPAGMIADILAIGGSKAVLNDTQIESNDGFLMQPLLLYGSEVQMNRCNISENHARGIGLGEDFPYEMGCIEIDSLANVSMNDVIIEGNTADGGEFCIIKNEGNLTLNKGTVIVKNSARQYSALFNTNTGVLNIGKGVVIADNHDDLQPSQPVYNEGILNQDVS